MASRDWKGLSSGIVCCTVCIELWCRGVNNIINGLYIDSSILKCHKVMLLTVCGQIIIIFLCKSVSA
jgi:hypothetical protein